MLAYSLSKQHQNTRSLQRAARTRGIDLSHTQDATEGLVACNTQSKLLQHLEAAGHESAEEQPFCAL
ncbi:hypothetical protein E2C01_016028 [Portunus trituberculatus]|uniref:Uncharacterized protein n=1 Tax=Portunus trituberculatus TaxID=210409 RepID=A0A5B7DPZ3_PORTR|nr:hypothetical protein [Portunus trituberculatus]